MQPIFRTVCFLICLLTSHFAHADEAADSFLKQAEARAKALKTLTARIELSWKSPNQALKRTTGNIKLMKPNFAIIELKGEYPLVTLASDGRSRYLFSEANKYSLAAAHAGGNDIDTPWWAFPMRFFFTQSIRPFGPDSPAWTSSRLTGTETIGGKTYSVIEIAGDKPMPYVARFYFDGKKLLCRSEVRFGDGDQAPVFTAQIEEITPARRLRPRDFSFKPPATARLDTGAEARMLAIGDSAPDFSLPTPEGDLLKLETAKGKKATLINFWYLACPPCRAEFELFQKLFAELNDQGFSVIAINNVDNANDIRAYARDNRLTFPIVMGERDAPGVVAAYKVQTYPSSYLINSEGKIVYQAVGVDEAGLLRSLREIGLQPQQPSQAYEFKNGKWFNGRSFTAKTFYSIAGVLSTKRPPRVDETIDLGGGFVVPPFGDAHCHHFDSSYNIDQQIKMYLRDGVFYAAVQTDVRSGAERVRDKVNRPDSVDVSYAHGALTSSYGHGVEVYEGLALLRRPGAVNPEEVKKLRESKLRANDAYYVIDTREDLERQWPNVLAGRPDFIKIYLLTSEEFETRRQRTDTIGDRGLDPKLVPLIVKKAHTASLRVSAHVDTVTDYRIALDAGVDHMAHLPGYYVNAEDNPQMYKLTDADARETARRGVWVIVAPVAYDMFNPQSRSYDAQLTKRTDAVRVHNLKLLSKHEARIALGSDRYGQTPVDDVMYLQRLKVFSNLDLLKHWGESTPQMIFPNRRIGRLQDGYEASFLVLAGNPLSDFSQVKNIRLRFKQGTFLSQ